MNAMIAEKWRKCIFSKRNFVEKAFLFGEIHPLSIKAKNNAWRHSVFLTLKCIKGVEI